MSTTLRSTPARSSRRMAGGAAPAVGRTRIPPPTWPRSPTMTPGVVKAPLPILTPPRVHQHDLLRVLGPQRLDHSRRARQSPRRRGVAHVVPAEYPAMHIRGGDDHDVGGIGNGGRGRGGGLLDGEHRQEQIHSALKIAEGARVALPCTTSMTESESHRILVVDD